LRPKRSFGECIGVAVKANHMAIGSIQQRTRIATRAESSIENDIAI